MVRTTRNAEGSPTRVSWQEANRVILKGFFNILFNTEALRYNEVRRMPHKILSKPWWIRGRVSPQHNNLVSKDNLVC